MAKSAQLQIRVTHKQKVQLKRLAAAAGQGVSAYVLARALPQPDLSFTRMIASLASFPDPKFPLAELNDLLSSLTAAQLAEATQHAELSRLSPLLQNYVAAMVEQASAKANVPPPAWTAKVEPLASPYFATPLSALRLHLLRSSPVPFRRRNIYVDSSVGDRV